MTVRYTFLNESKQWAVIGPDKEMALGPVQVTKNNGQVKTERIVRLSPRFNKDGVDFCFGFIAALPRGSAKPVLAAAPASFVPPVISEPHFAAVERAERMRLEAAQSRSQLVTLLNYVMNMREDYPDLAWPDLPDTYTSKVWESVA
jgi:hypothetical protein